MSEGLVPPEFRLYSPPFMDPSYSYIILFFYFLDVLTKSAITLDQNFGQNYETEFVDPVENENILLNCNNLDSRLFSEWLHFIHSISPTKLCYNIKILSFNCIQYWPISLGYIKPTCLSCPLGRRKRRIFLFVRPIQTSSTKFDAKYSFFLLLHLVSFHIQAFNIRISASFQTLLIREF